MFGIVPTRWLINRPKTKAVPLSYMINRPKTKVIPPEIHYLKAAIPVMSIPVINK